MRIQKEKDLKLYIKGSVAFLLFMVLALLTFFYFVQRDVNKNVEKTLMDNVERQNHHLQTILDLQFQNLESVAEGLGCEEELTSEKNMNTIRILQKNSDFERVSIIDTEGNSHYDEGSVKNVAQRRYFMEGIAGNRTLSDPLESSVDGQTRVVLGVPIYEDGDSEKEVIGILGASYDMTALSRMLFDDIYGGEGFSMILTRDGDVISYDTENSVGSKALQSIGENLFQIYEDSIQNDTETSDVVGDFSKGQSGCSEINTGDNSWYMAYTPLSYNNWMVCYSIPSKSARNAYQFINRYEVILCIALALAVMVLMFAIRRAVKGRQKDLLEYANTDALTGLYNKEKTKNEIKQWMEQVGEHAGIQVFFIMDIDFFKEINDTYGHVNGDRVLHNVGELLKTQFRAGDIVGRVGGDEFVVFMKNVDSVDHVLDKIHEISAGIGNLCIPELKGNVVTLSIGVSYAPDHGTTYLELYEHADEALYETKRNGKNGYTIYTAEA